MRLRCIFCLSTANYTIEFLADGQLNIQADCKVDQSHETFSIWVFFDPLYTNPLVLGTNMFLQPVSLFKFYLDRWPVEPVPLVAKQMLGLHRQFVFAPESCQRLLELAMLVGNILSYLALVLPPIPTGFWDRRQKQSELTQPIAA